MSTTCTCGETEPHVVARRETTDGLRVELWDNGAVTGGYGYALDGIPIARPRTAEGLFLARAAGWFFVGWVEWYERAEIAELYAACRKVAARGGLPGDVGAEVLAAREAVSAPRLQWFVCETDNRGAPTVRTARLPRMRWPGLVVWHEHGRYELLAGRHFRGEESLVNTGFSFASQRELFRHLMQVQGDALAADH